MSAGDWKELYRSATEGNLELVRYHIASGVDPNYQHPEILSTPLVAAILNNHTEIAIFLLENGADAGLESSLDALKPLGAAKKMKNQKLIGIIIKRL